MLHIGSAKRPAGQGTNARHDRLALSPQLVAVLRVDNFTHSFVALLDSLRQVSDLIRDETLLVHRGRHFC